MRIVKLYRYERADGGINVSPNKPDGEYTETLRLIADEGKALVKDGSEPTYCIDTDTADGWCEVDTPEEGDT